MLINKSYKILDIACGTGLYERLINPSIRKQQHITGVDISSAQLSYAKEIFDEILVTDIEQELPYKDESFDLIILSEIIEHLFYPEQIINECYRLLKKGGRLVFTTPNISSIQNRLSFTIFGNSKEIDYLYNKQHIRFYSNKTLKTLFSKFRLLHSRGLACLYFFGNHFPVFIPIPLILQKMFSILFPNSGAGFLKIYQK